MLQKWQSKASGLGQDLPEQTYGGTARDKLQQIVNHKRFDLSFCGCKKSRKLSNFLLVYKKKASVNNSVIFKRKIQVRGVF